MARSLRLQLLGWTLAPLGLLAGLNAVIAYRDAIGTADLVTDDRLMSSARAIAEATRSDGGILQPLIPPAALEMFDTGAGDFVYYRVTDGRGRLLAGTADLPDAPRGGRPETTAYEAPYRGRMLRLLALDGASAGPGLQSDPRVLVGCSLGGRDAMVRRLWSLGFAQQVALLLAAAVFIGFGLKRGLAPLLKLRDAVRGRPATSLEPVAPEAVQAEIRPLVEAINRQIDRVRAQLAAQHRFVTNAAHQLRTPLTVLSLQATYASRQSGGDAAALDAIRSGIAGLSRLVDQLLTLSRAEPGSRRPREDRVALAALARRVLDEAAGRALDAGVDLGLDERVSEVAVVGDAMMLEVALTNLVDNALRYCPAGSHVTAVVDRDRDRAILRVEDDGPGVPAGAEEQIFERFFRVIGSEGPGSGLGLAIVKEVAEAAGGSAVAMGTGAHGLAVEMRLRPAASEEGATEPVSVR